jgi:hypothetical protein
MTLDIMYKQFVEEFRTGNNQQAEKGEFLKTNGGIDRKAIFEKKVRAIISHNTDGSKTWKKGINAYSDMTH